MVVDKLILMHSRARLEDMLRILREQSRARILYISLEGRLKSPSEYEDDELIQEIFLELEAITSALESTDSFDKPAPTEEERKKYFEDFDWENF